MEGRALLLQRQEEHLSDLPLEFLGQLLPLDILRTMMNITISQVHLTQQAIPQDMVQGIQAIRPMVNHTMLLRLSAVKLLELPLLSRLPMQFKM